MLQKHVMESEGCQYCSYQQGIFFKAWGRKLDGNWMLFPSQRLHSTIPSSTSCWPEIAILPLWFVWISQHVDSKFLSSVLVSLNLTLCNTRASLVPNFGLSSTFWKALDYHGFMGRYWLDCDYANWWILGFRSLIFSFQFFIACYPHCDFFHFVGSSSYSN
jgi:hypothetical protein